MLIYFSLVPETKSTQHAHESIIVEPLLMEMEDQGPIKNN